MRERRCARPDTLPSGTETTNKTTRLRHRSDPRWLATGVAEIYKEVVEEPLPPALADLVRRLETKA